MMAYASWYYIICKIDKNNKLLFSRRYAVDLRLCCYNIIKCSMLQLLGKDK